MKNYLTIAAISLIAILQGMISLSWADQWEWIPQKEAEMAFKQVKKSKSVRLFCLPCGDYDYEEISVSTVALKKTPDNQHERKLLFVNDTGVDLAYTYIKMENKWRNLAIHLGLETESTPLYIPPPPLMYFSHGMINYWEQLRYDDDASNLLADLIKSLELGYERAGIVIKMIESKDYGKVFEVYENVLKEIKTEAFFQKYLQ
ncbi:MAG: hypothetical protein HN472_08645 [Nitrospina sp.]|jgi:hypothetical protein|nr:hypothetical protein [Nitrospina sp.]MBT4047199.1 hypothetical protein [Nitrospina sp.]MBT4556182.1 hypothetical protein [Nitrospina sp.]MBT6741109.1 hypothetical protein [Nitrospina sp.]MBT7682759.1 hypothetical protein [Nitrospina sp.]